MPITSIYSHRGKLGTDCDGFIHSFVRLDDFGLLSFDTPRRDPEHPRRGERINSPSRPPCDFVSEAMDVTVMGSAQRYREFIADLESHCPRLSEAQMVGVSGASAADQTRPRCNELEMAFVAMPTWFNDREHA